MKDRIIKNEERFNRLTSIIKELDESLENFESNKKDYYLLNKYYGSSSWFDDKELFEKGKISNINAGVLSEDAIWNMIEEVSDIMARMNNIVKYHNKYK